MEKEERAFGSLTLQGDFSPDFMSTGSDGMVRIYRTFKDETLLTCQSLNNLFTYKEVKVVLSHIISSSYFIRDFSY